MERVFQAGPFPVTTNLLSVPVDLPVLDARRGVGPRAARGRRSPLRRRQGLRLALRAAAWRPAACMHVPPLLRSRPTGVVSTLGCSK